MRRGIGFVAGVVFGIALVATCARDTGPSTADLGAHDLAGARDLASGSRGADLNSLGDLFPRLDIAAADAAGSGSMVYTVTNCDKSSTRTVVYSTFTTTTTYYFAEVSVPGLLATDSPHVTATGCDFTYFGSSAAPPSYSACPSGAGITSCGDSGYTLPAGSCVPVSTFVAPGKVIVDCGYHLTYSNAMGESGSLPANIYVRVN